jgi:hypothetical protein
MEPGIFRLWKPCFRIYPGLPEAWPELITEFPPQKGPDSRNRSRVLGEKKVAPFKKLQPRSRNLSL